MPALLTRMSMRPSAFERGVARLGDRGRVGDVAGDGRDLLAQRLGGLLRQRDVVVPDRDLGAGFQEALGDRLAEALRAAGDDGDAALRDRCRLPCVASPMLATRCRLGYHKTQLLRQRMADRTRASCRQALTSSAEIGCRSSAVIDKACSEVCRNGVSISAHVVKSSRCGKCAQGMSVFDYREWKSWEVSNKSMT